MLFDSALRKELGRSLLATLVVLLTIMLTMMLIRTLGIAAAGEVSAEDVALFLAYATLGFMPVILSLTLFVATIATFTRMYRDSEMSVWFSSGVSIKRFIRPVLGTAMPLLLLLALSGFVGRPWGQARVADLRERQEHRSDLSKIAPGEFQSSSDGQRVFYIDRRGSDASVGTHVFILSTKGSVESVTTSQEGRVRFEEERRLLELSAGQRTSVNRSTGDVTQARFDTAVALVSETPLTENGNRQPRALSSWALLWEPGPAFQAELAWRLGLVLGAFNLLLLGLGLSRGGPRQSSNWNLIVGLLSFVVYYNLMTLVQSWSGTGRLPAWPALLALHGSALALALGLLWWRQSGGLFHPLRPRARAR